MASYTPSLLEHDAHPLVAKLQKAKARLNAIIADYQTAIDDLNAQISKNVKDTEDMQADKAKVVGNYDATLQRLADEKARLSNEKAAAEDDKAKTQNELTTTTEEGEAAIQSLLNTLSQSISDLKAQRAQAEADKAAQIVANAAAAKDFADSKTQMEKSRAAAKEQGESLVQGYTDRIAKLTSSRDAAQAEYTSLMNSDTGASLLDVFVASEMANHPLAERLRKAKEHLKGVITEWENKLQRLEALLSKNSLDIDSMKNAKKKLDDQYAADLQALAKEKARLESDKTSSQLNKTLAEQDLNITTEQGEAEIQRLKDNLSKSIADLKAEIAQNEADKTTQIASNAAVEKSFQDSLTQLEASRAAAETQGNNAVQALTDMIAKLTASIDTTQAEYNDLQSSDAGSFLQMLESPDGEDHPLAERIRKAKERLNALIDEYTAQITNLDSLLSANKQETDTANADRQKAIDNYDASLKALADEKARLEKSRTSNQDKKASTESELAKTIVDSERQIARLLTDLRNSVSNLKLQRRKAEQDRTQQINTNMAILTAATNSHASTVNGLQSQIDQLKQDKKDAQDRLDALKEKHDIQ